MKFTSTVIMITIVFIMASSFKSSPAIGGKDPIVMEAMTKYTVVSDALAAAKSALLNQKFIIQGDMGASSFTAKKTTGSQADYYIADVSATLIDGKAKVTINFVKVGTGMLKLQKVADDVKAELEK